MHFKKTLRAILLLAIGSSCAGPVLADNPFPVYRNWRYSYQISYPVSFIPQGEPDAGDGQLFIPKSKDAEMRVSGWPCVDEMDYPGEVIKKYEKSEKEQKLRITYRHKTKGSAVISGFRGNRIFYAKSLFQEGWCADFELEYDQARRDQYDQLVTPIANSFKRYEYIPQPVN